MNKDIKRIYMAALVYKQSLFATYGKDPSDKIDIETTASYSNGIFKYCVGDVYLAALKYKMPLYYYSGRRFINIEIAQYDKINHNFYYNTIVVLNKNG